jgi:hypothetical protein
MVVENFPELASLDAEQKLILAGELWKSVTAPSPDSPEVSPALIALLEERLNHFKANPATGISWADLRGSKKSH